MNARRRPTLARVALLAAMLPLCVSLTPLNLRLASAQDEKASGAESGKQDSADRKQGDQSKDKNEPRKDDAAASGTSGDEGGEKPKLSPEQKMERRFPQPVRVGYLIGLPVLDESNAILTRVQSVVRTPGGKVQLIVPYGGLFGIGSRLVAIPVELVAMLGRQVVAVDMPSASFETAPTYYGSGAETLSSDTVIRVGVMRR